MNALDLITATVEPLSHKRRYAPLFARALADLVAFRPRSPDLHSVANAEAYLGHLKSHPLVAINVMRVPGVHSDAQPSDVFVTMRLEKDVISRYWEHYGSIAECIRLTKERLNGLVALLESQRGSTYADFRSAFQAFNRDQGMSGDQTGKSLWSAYCKSR